MSDPTDRHLGARPRTSRRAVLRTAGHAAWAAPVIVAASAAPAMAVSGAAAITTTPPSFTIPLEHVRAAVTFANRGMVAASSMTVTITITPLQGTLRDVPPRINSAGFSLVRSVVNDDGSQTIVLAKLDPQIEPGDTAPLSLDFFQDPDGTTGFRTGLFTVTPTVPLPGQALGSSGDYNTTVSAS